MNAAATIAPGGATVRRVVIGPASAPRGQLRTYLLIGVGGAVGAAALGLGELWAADGDGWPWATSTANLVGCLLIGLAVRRLEPGSARWSTWVVGVLGGFTTMSAFAQELNELADAGRTGLAVLYATTSVAAGYVAVLIGTRGAAVPERLVEDTE